MFGMRQRDYKREVTLSTYGAQGACGLGDFLTAETAPAQARERAKAEPPLPP